MSNEKLTKLRSLMAENNIDGYIVRCTDAHNSEYSANCDKRLSFITGFTGSNGLAYITKSQAFIWTDSRYYIQAEQQLESGWEMKKMEFGLQPWFETIKAESAPSTKIGFNPLFMNYRIYTLLENSWKEKQLTLCEIQTDLVDEIWGKDKPAMPKQEVFIHELEFCGQSLEQKVNELREKLQQKNGKLFFTSALDEIAWILNLRCDDINYNPYFFSYLIIEFQEENKFAGTLYILPEKINPQVKEYLTKNNISIKNYFEVFNDLKELKQNIILDENACNYKVISTIDKNFRINFSSPLQLMKAIKNQRQQQGMIDCHVAYLAWLEDQILVQKNTKLTEFEGSKKVKEFREMQKLNKGLAFETISSIGANGAIVHYFPSEAESAVINDKEVYLLDSGAQYLDGTTDVTRTLHFGTPTADQKDSYTRVLLGNLDIERTIWPRKWKINGEDLDVLARRRLWANYKDFGHGTGHGVGYFLGVHEGPCGISKRVTQEFIDGMVVSNGYTKYIPIFHSIIIEPGYYQENSYGIRIENCLMVVNDENNSTFQKFRNLTMCPYDRKLIDFTLLTKEDVHHINKYHQQVLEILTPVLKEQGLDQALAWLIKETKPL